jgi:hypothetical protein
MIRSQIDNLIFEPYFGNNSQFIFSNGECELTFDIYVLIVFQWYEEFSILTNPNPFIPRAT